MKQTNHIDSPWNRAEAILASLGVLLLLLFTAGDVGSGLVGEVAHVEQAQTSDDRGVFDAELTDVSQREVESGEHAPTGVAFASAEPLESPSVPSADRSRRTSHVVGAAASDVLAYAPKNSPPSI